MAVKHLEASFVREVILLIVMLSEGDDLIAREAHYHLSCKKMFVNNNRLSSGNKQCMISENFHLTAWNNTLQMINEEILLSGGPMFGTELHDFYKNCYINAGGYLADVTDYPFQAV